LRFRPKSEKSPFRLPSLVPSEVAGLPGNGEDGRRKLRRVDGRRCGGTSSRNVCQISREPRCVLSHTHESRCRARFKAVSLKGVVSIEAAGHTGAPHVDTATESHSNVCDCLTIGKNRTKLRAVKSGMKNVCCFAGCKLFICSASCHLSARSGSSCHMTSNHNVSLVKDLSTQSKSTREIL
jgi:hypothetical protein